jgi:hypothetical protein
MLRRLAVRHDAGALIRRHAVRHEPWLRLMSRRDGAIVAWHEVPGTAPPQKSRPVGYGLIRKGVRTDAMIGVEEV